MKKAIRNWALLLAITPSGLLAQYNNQRQDVFDKANNAVNKAVTAIAVFQPYLLKARQLFYDAKQMAGDFKRDAKGVFRKDSSQPGTYYNNGGVQSGSYNSNGSTQSGTYNTTQSGTYNTNGTQSGTYNSNGGSYPTGGANGSYNNNGVQGGYNSGTYGNSPPTAASYLPGQSLPINNPATINNDGTGNWGNQNNGLYGNALDALTGTVMGMGDAAESPGSVDLLFFAPADGQNTYYLMTPGFARNNGTATYMTEHTSDQVKQWPTVNESEVAMTKLTLNQFNQIQTNGQIQSAARNAQEYSGNYASVGQKLDGSVIAIRTQTAGREVYALVAVIKQYGTSGSEGYLKIAIKSTGVDLNRDGQADANAYLRGN